MGFNDFLECGADDTVVVQRTGAMGDVIWTTPLFKYMRDHGFKGSITVATQHPEVFKNNPHVTNVVSPACVKNVMGQEGTWNLDWSYESDRNKHMLEAYCDVLGIDFALVEKYPLLYPDFNHVMWAHKTVLSGPSGCKGTIVIHAASSPDRAWSCLRWEQLVSRLVKVGFFIICVGASEDYHLQPRREVLDLVGKTQLVEVAALIENANAFIGIDSGIANVAFSTKTPSIVLYGMAEPYTRLPFSSSVHYGITANESDCSCIGCLKKLPVHAPPLCHNFQRAKCMDLISVNAVFDAFMELRNFNEEIP